MQPADCHAERSHVVIGLLTNVKSIADCNQAPGCDILESMGVQPAPGWYVKVECHYQPGHKPD
jgi:hypothetical protein